LTAAASAPATKSNTKWPIAKSGDTDSNVVGNMD
jgi:hypothetical protein